MTIFQHMYIKLRLTYPFSRYPMLCECMRQHIEIERSVRECEAFVPFERCVS